jgi:hypothetical protein
LAPHRAHSARQKVYDNEAEWHPRAVRDHAVGKNDAVGRTEAVSQTAGIDGSNPPLAPVFESHFGARCLPRAEDNLGRRRFAGFQ